MKKEVLFFVILMTTLSCVLFACGKENENQHIEKDYSICVRNCTMEKSIQYDSCREDFKNMSAQCNIQKKGCQASINNRNRTIINLKRKNCSNSFTSCVKNLAADKESCFKNVSSVFHSCSDICKWQKHLCLKIFKPVCGIDNKTYPNTCYLKAAAVLPAYNGTCNVTSLCDKEHSCKLFFSSCTCSWQCVKTIPRFTCGRACPEVFTPKPECSCESGKCVQKPKCGDHICEPGESCEKDCACRETDKGTDILKKGAASIGNELYVDRCTYCTGACTKGKDCHDVLCGAVVEYSCNATKIINQTIVCPENSTCRDGECKKISDTNN